MPVMRNSHGILIMSQTKSPCQSPHNPTYGWLHVEIKKLIDIKNKEEVITTSPRSWQAESIQSVLFEPFPHPDRWLHVKVDSLEYAVCLSKLSLPRLQALDQFMAEREATWQPRQTLEQACNRKALEGRLVQTCCHIYSRFYIAQLIGHSRDRHCDHLGDCWLVQFKIDNGWGNASYIGADTLYLVSAPQGMPSEFEQMDLLEASNE